MRAILLILISSVFCSPKSYDKIPLFRCRPSEPQKNLLIKWQDEFELDLWKIGEDAEFIDLLFTKTLKDLMHYHKEDPWRCQLRIVDVQKVIDEMSSYRAWSVEGEDDYFLEYHRWEENIQHLRDLNTQYSHITTLVPSYGQSIEGRNLTTFRVSSESQVPGPRWQVWIEGGIHAREWITPATNLYVLNEFLQGYGNDERITNIINRIDLYFTPHVNPDGYEYTWTNDRLWRKNRRLNQGGSYGVDLNRNFDDTRWRPGNNPNGQTWPGSGPASEPETRNIQDFIRNLPNPLAGVDIHSYGQEVYWDGDDEWFRRCGEDQIAAIAATTGTPYVGIRRTDGLNVGMMQDFFTHGAQVPGHGWMYEVRDRGQYGFLLPPDQIIPVGTEITEAVISWLEALIQQFGAPQK